MSHDRNRNAKLIIPLAACAWLGGILVAKNVVPAWVGGVFVVAFALAVPALVLYLIGEAGWRTLARRYRTSVADRRDWRLCPTGQMGPVSVHEPDFQKLKMRFIGGSLAVATSADALHLRTMVSSLPLLRGFFPELRVPWAEVHAAQAFEAKGWVSSVQPGALLQAAYDPNYSGKFIELQIGEPTVYVQLPAWILGAELARLDGLLRDLPSRVPQQPNRE